MYKQLLPNSSIQNKYNFIAHYLQNCNATGFVISEEYTWITNITSNWTLAEVYLHHKHIINYAKIGAIFKADSGAAYFDDFKLIAYEKPEPYMCMVA